MDNEKDDETSYLLSSPANARHLRKSLAQAERGEGITFNSVEELQAEIKEQEAAAKKGHGAIQKRPEGAS